jgi:hypothetical protein
MVDQRLAVVAHRPHHRVPADAELTGDAGHGLPVLAHPAHRPRSGPFGQHRPRCHLGRGLRPGALPARALGAAPQPLRPHQHHRPAAGGQVADQHRSPTVRLRHHPAARAAATVAAVSTSSSTSPATSPADSTTNSGKPSNTALGSPVASERTWGLLDLLAWSLQIVRPQALRQAEADERVVIRSPSFVAKSPFTSTPASFCPRIWPASRVIRGRRPCSADQMTWCRPLDCSGGHQCAHPSTPGS